MYIVVTSNVVAVLLIENWSVGKALGICKKLGKDSKIKKVGNTEKDCLALQTSENYKNVFTLCPAFKKK